MQHRPDPRSSSEKCNSSRKKPSERILKKPLRGKEITFLSLLLIIPFSALLKGVVSFNIDWWYPTTCVSLISIITYSLYGSDKRAAQSGAWRVPESTLHLLELSGGWPAAFIAQRQFRHKTAKTSFQWTYGFIVLLHELIALDYLLQFRILKLAYKLMPL